MGFIVLVISLKWLPVPTYQKAHITTGSLETVMSEVGLKAFWHYDMATSPQWSESRMWYPVGVAPLVRDPNPHLPGGVAR